MTDFEERLRHDLRNISEHARPESIRPLRIPPSRRRSRAVRWLAPVAAMAAVTGIITAVSLTEGATGNRPVSAGAAAVMPRYYVTLHSVIPGNITATVRDSATGASLESVLVMHADLRRGHNVPAGLIWITAAANDRVFAIGDVLGVDVLRLAADGHVERLSHLPKKIIPGLLDGMPGLLSPDGTELALSNQLSVRCSGGVLCPTGADVTVVSLATGATRTWTWRGEDPPFIHLLNWPGNGHEVFFLDQDSPRLLNVSGPGGSLLASSRPIAAPVLPRGWGSWNRMLTPDGKAVIAGIFPDFTPRQPVTCRIAEFSARTGRLLRVLYTATANPSPAFGYVPCEGPESLAPSGRNVLIEGLGHFGRLEGSHYTALPGWVALEASGLHATELEAAW